MPAYVINEIVVTEPTRFQTYADRVPAILKQYGGEYVIRGGAPERVDGPGPPDKLVVLRFASREAARAWRNSPEYLAILPIREATSTSRVYIVDGYEA
ncbi:MAG: DUF1330 domain-containing protein [Alphaproteobacteria bacterium]|nr:DUF1330 domain-containing protein [Alphaproteobacteria bacterium]MBU1514150.1 DUF1330 domain-containing protein [Alphaproteobacteria bacterium]MBU2096201.1 DUF1330 domain-containing protein [Alphaproteobacteria bacterium]MBU2151155.1 DUF1330 domain-containing protein [Alphaproteobacteria bacterium]MBU2307186.1 DUF1330 domain-containing protein [Alphaproteobacteria bacterium]